MKTSIPLPPNRQAALLQRRRMKMAESAHAYVRGSTLKFYEWLESGRAAKIVPEGPPVWICGDCHIGNLGPVASSDGRVKIQIRDLDQTVIGNPVHDIMRLSLSLAMAARSSDLPGVTTALMVEEVMRGYRAGLRNRSVEGRETKIEPIQLVMKEALRRKWRHLAEERIEDVRPHIPLGKRFWALTDAERREIARIFTDEGPRKLITSLKSRSDKDAVTVLDAAYWIKGCSSLGRARYAVLVGIGKNCRDGMSLVDLKESVKPSAPRAKGMTMPVNNAERVVAGARALSPFLGERMLPVRFLGKAVVLRELMPQDLKFDMDHIGQKEAVAAAKLLANVVGKAHGRQLSPQIRDSWIRELGRNHSKTINAPSWLWSCVVDLASSHEAAYLEHCRLYALGA